MQVKIRLNKVSKSSRDEKSGLISKILMNNFSAGHYLLKVPEKMPTALAAIVIGLLLFSTQSTARTLQLVTLQYPPYIYKEGENIKGIAVQIIRESFRRMQQPIRITMLPWSRAIMQIQNGNADAIFTAYKNPERETFADYSKGIVMPQIVSLFVLKDSSITWNGDFKVLTKYSVVWLEKSVMESYLIGRLRVISLAIFNTLAAVSRTWKNY